MLSWPIDRPRSCASLCRRPLVGRTSDQSSRGCERALKRAIVHRKNSLFYKTPRGARVGDLFMSLIHTCELCRANPFDYLTELERHADELASNPGNWMPWNYREAFHHQQESRDSTCPSVV